MNGGGLVIVVSKVKLRAATPLDHIELVELLKKWMDEVEINGIPGPTKIMDSWIADLVVNQTVIIAEIDGKIVGTIGLRVFNYPWNDEITFLLNDFLMVDKDYRKFGVCNKLLEASIDFATKNKVVLIIGHNNGKDTELKDRYLQMKGMQYAGGKFIFKGDK